MYLVPTPYRVPLIHPSTYDPKVNKEHRLNERVSEVFDEFHKLISKPIEFHPSDKVNRKPERQYFNSNSYEIINSYHGYCKLCNKHYYSRSVLDDINSYFQRHMNSYYHRTCQALKPAPNSQPIFEWEKWLVTGSCNICEMKGIHSFIIHSDLDIQDLLKRHDCHWSPQQRLDNEKFIDKIQALRSFCGLKIFSDKFIKSTFNEGKDESVCVLCYSLLLGSKKTATYHLFSVMHFKKFCSFIWRTFQFTLNDLLNGYNLEAVIQWGLTQDYKAPMFLINESDDLKTCLELSYNDTDVYDDQEFCGFSPIFINEVLKIQNCDFISSTVCLLCNEKIQNCFHVISEKHIQRAADLSQFYETEEFITYLKNRENRLKAYDSQIRMYRKIKRKLLDYGLQFGMSWRPEFQDKLLKMREKIVKSTSHTHLLGESPNADELETGSLLLQSNKVFSLMREKLERVNKTFTQVGRNSSICEVCDLYLSVKAQDQHVSGDAHLEHIKKWTTIIINFKFSKFLEPIQAFGCYLGCYICGQSLREHELIDHLKSSTHLQNFKEYEKLNFPLPISKCFKFGFNNSCICKKCKLQLSVKGSNTLNSILNSIKKHYPCLEVKPDNESSQDKHNSQLDLKDKVANCQSMKSEVLIFCSFCGLPFKETATKICGPTCSKISFSSFDVIKSRIEDIVNVCECAIVKCIFDSSNNIISKICSMNQETSSPESSNTSVTSETPITCNNEPNQPCSSNLPWQQIPESQGDMFAASLESISKKTVCNADNNVCGTDQVEVEILVIMGLSEDKEKYQKTYCLFKDFGPIRYLYFKHKTGILQFGNHGTALKVLEKGPYFIDGDKLSLACITRPITADMFKNMLELQIPKICGLGPHCPYIFFLLKTPSALHAFVLQLLFQSRVLNTSAQEKLREAMVCNVIIGAIKNSFSGGKCCVFGSRLSGLNINNSDLDIFLDCGETFEGYKTTGYTLEKKLLFCVSNALKMRSDCQDINVVHKARVPIVSFTHSPTNLRCDISFKNGLGVQNTLLIRYMMSLDSRVKPLILFLKYWTVANELHGPPCFSSYAIAMLVIFFLEQEPLPILPTVEYLQNIYVGKRVTIGGWDCSFSTDPTRVPKTRNKLPLQILFVNFFEFYSKFNYAKFVISPLTGKVLFREQLQNPDKLPMPYKRHAHNIPNKNFISKEISICILDPFDLSHILTKKFPKHDFLAFVHFCHLSANDLKCGLGITANEGNMLRQI